MNISDYFYMHLLTLHNVHAVDVLLPGSFISYACRALTLCVCILDTSVGYRYISESALL